jgi:hypothetical protein
MCSPSSSRAMKGWDGSCKTRYLLWQCRCVFLYLKWNRKTNVYIRLVFKLIPGLFFFLCSNPNYLTFKKVSVVTPPVKISVWNGGSLLKPLPPQLHLPHTQPCLLSSHFPTCLPRLRWEPNRWLYLRHWLSYRNQKGSRSPLLLPDTTRQVQSAAERGQEPAASKPNEGRNWTPSSHPVRISTGYWTKGF